MTQHTPTTDEIREAYVMTGDGLDFKSAAERRGEEFDLWLAQHDAEVRASTKPYRGPRCGDSNGTTNQRGTPIVCDRIEGHRGSHSYRSRWFWGEPNR